MTDPVVIVGGASLDTIIHLDTLPTGEPQTLWPSESYKAVGSTGAGKALNLAALGYPVTLHTLLGRDAEGEHIRRHLNRSNITLLVNETDTPTEQHTNLMAADGGRISLFTQPPATPATLDWRPVEEAMGQASCVVVNILAYTLPALAIARQSAIPLWTDLHDYDGQTPHHQPFIDAADVLFLSSDRLTDYRAFMTSQIATGKTLVVCTHGDKGATLLSHTGEWIEQPALKVSQVVDTNGAGDAFFSGFLAAYLRGDPLARCMLSAAACGASCVMSRDLVGAVPQALMP
ncbi:carbohydrate kinase family protein [Marinobacter sp. 1Y8]